MAVVIEYPSSINTDGDKLSACYSLIEQHRLEHNKVAEQARSNPDKYIKTGKFKAYAEKSKAALKQLLAERNQIIENIRTANYTEKEWQQVGKLSEEEYASIHKSLFGNKSEEKIKPTRATSPLLDELRAQSLDDKKALAPDPTEDFSAYTEYDEGSDITKTADRITFTNAETRDDTFYVYDDKGAGHFDGDFEHREKVLESVHNTAAVLVSWIVANAVADLYALIGANESCLSFFLYHDAGGYYMRLRERDSATSYTDEYQDFSLSTVYYLQIERDESVGTYGTIYAYIATSNYYSDGGSLVDTLSVTLHTSKKDYRYVYGLSGYDSSKGIGYTATGYVELLDLQEAVAETYTKTVSIDALLQTTDTNQPTIDALLRDTDKTETDLDALIRGEASQTPTLDGLIKALGVSKTVALDTLIRILGLSDTVDLDTLIQRTDRNKILYEYYNTGDSGNTDPTGTHWCGQTFTPSTSHKITSVKLKLFRYGSPGTVTVSIRNTVPDGDFGEYLPTGGDLCSGTIDGDTLTTSGSGEWYEVTLGAGYNLVAGTVYAIVVRAPSGSNPSNILYWRLHSLTASYDGGTFVCSEDSGENWTSDEGYGHFDCMFEEWGGGLQIDALIQKADSQVIDTDALLKALGDTKMIAISALLRALGISETIDIDALVGKAGSKTIDIDTLIETLGTKTLTISALLRALGVDTTVAVDALIQTLDTETATIDALLRKLGVDKTVALDLLLSGSVSETVDLDLRIQALDSQGVDLDALLKAIDTATVSLDTRIQTLSEVFVDIDAYLRAMSVIETVDLDALLQATGVSVTVLLDALIYDRLEQTIDVDLLLQGESTVTPLLDLLLQGTASTTVALDAIIAQAYAGALTFQLEVHNTDGDLVAILENAFGISYDARINQPHKLTFSIPAADSKQSDITLANEIWLRNLKTNTVVRKFRIQVTRDERNA
jgi:hypothetical protein